MSRSTRTITITMEQQNKEAEELKQKDIHELLVKLDRKLKTQLAITQRPDDKITSELKDKLENPAVNQLARTKAVVKFDQADLEKTVALLKKRFDEEKKSPQQDGYNRDTIIDRMRRAFELIERFPSESDFDWKSEFDIERESLKAGFSLILGIEDNMDKRKSGLETKCYVSGLTEDETIKMGTVQKLFRNEFIELQQATHQAQREAKQFQITANSILKTIEQMERITTLRQLLRLSELREMKTPTDALQDEMNQLLKIEIQLKAKIGGELTATEMRNIININVTDLIKTQNNLLNSLNKNREEYLRYIKKAENYKQDLKAIQEQLSGEKPAQLSKEELLSNEMKLSTSLKYCESEIKEYEQRANKLEKEIKYNNQMHQEIGLSEILNAFNFTEQLKKLMQEFATIQQVFNQYHEKLISFQKDKAQFAKNINAHKIKAGGISAKIALQKEEQILKAEETKLNQIEKQLNLEKENLSNQIDALAAKNNDIQEKAKQFKDNKLFSDLGYNWNDNIARQMINIQANLDAMRNIPIEKFESKSLNIDDSIDLGDYTKNLLATTKQQIQNADKFTIEAKALMSKSKEQSESKSSSDAKIKEQMLQLIAERLKIEPEKAAQYYAEWNKISRRPFFNFTPDIISAENHLSFLPKRFDLIETLAESAKKEMADRYEHHIRYFEKAAQSHIQMLKTALDEKNPETQRQMIGNLIFEISLKQTILENPLFFQPRHALLGLPHGSEGGGLEPLQSCLERGKKHNEEILAILRENENFLKPKESKLTAEKSEKKSEFKFTTQAQAELQQARENAAVEFKMISKEKDFLNADQAIAWVTRIMNMLDDPTQTHMTDAEVRKSYLQILEVAVNRSMSVSPTFDSIKERAKAAEDFVKGLTEKPLTLSQIEEKLIELRWRKTIRDDILVPSPTSDRETYRHGLLQESKMNNEAREILLPLYLKTALESKLTPKQLDEHLRFVDNQLKNSEPSAQADHPVLERVKSILQTKKAELKDLATPEKATRSAKTNESATPKFVPLTDASQYRKKR